MFKEDCPLHAVSKRLFTYIGRSRYGGSWYRIPRFCRSARYTWGLPGSRYIDCGFRVVVAGTPPYPLSKEKKHV